MENRAEEDGTATDVARRGAATFATLEDDATERNMAEGWKRVRERKRKLELKKREEFWKADDDHTHSLSLSLQSLVRQSDCLNLKKKKATRLKIDDQKKSKSNRVFSLVLYNCSSTLGHGHEFF